MYVTEYDLRLLCCFIKAVSPYINTECAVYSEWQRLLVLLVWIIHMWFIFYLYYRVMLILDIPVNFNCKSPHPIILLCLFIALKDFLFRSFTVHIINHHWLSCCCFLPCSVCAGLLQTPVLAKHSSLAAECTMKNSNYCSPFHTHTLFCHRF